MFQIDGAGYQSGEAIPIATGGPEQTYLNVDLSNEVTEPARVHPTSADQLDTGSGSDGAPAGLLG